MELTTRPGAPEGITGSVGAGMAPVDSDQFSRALLSAMLSFRAGDFAARMPADLLGVEGKIADAFNDVVALQRAPRPGDGAREPGGREGRQAETAHDRCPAWSAAGRARWRQSTR